MKKRGRPKKKAAKITDNSIVSDQELDTLLENPIEKAVEQSEYDKLIKLLQKRPDILSSYKGDVVEERIKRIAAITNFKKPFGNPEVFCKELQKHIKDKFI